MSHEIKKDFTELSSRLQTVFTYKNWSTLWQTYKLIQKWPAIVGENVAQKSEPAYIQKDTLWVYVESSVLMQHMQPQKLNLLEKINSLSPDTGIKDIRWAMQPAKAPSKEHKEIRNKKIKASPEERETFEAMTSTVEDDKCRQALQKLWDTFHNR